MCFLFSYKEEVFYSMSIILDEVKAVITAESAKNLKDFSKYIEAQKYMKSMQDKGLIQKKKNTLLPIEERYKSAYICV